MFRRIPRRDDEESRSLVTIFIEGKPIQVPTGEMVAAAVLASGLGWVRSTPVSGAPRMPYCLMGVCFECLMEIDGVPNSQACMTQVREGMRVERQAGVRPFSEV
jgi:predicted molibdopterin-dependent oxidoreductase YjgC